MTDVDQIQDIPGIGQEKKLGEPTLRTKVDQLAEIDVEGKIKKGGPYKQPAEHSQGLPLSDGEEMATAGDEEAPEADRARIERLGRDRPPRFKSLGAELAFCYSVIASPIMSVRYVAAALFKGSANTT